MTNYFVRKGIYPSDPFRVVYREVETVDPATGYPLTFTLKALSGVYTDYAQAQAEADRLNAMMPPAQPEPSNH